MKKKVCVFGNEYLDNDNFSHEIAAQLQQEFEIIKCRSPDDLLEEEGKITILDVVKNTKEPILIKDLSTLKYRKLISLHDFDLSFFLNLLKELNVEKDINIIGIPEQGNKKEIINKIKEWL